MSEPAYGSLSFAEQLAFFRAKINLPTERWDDIWQSAHDRAFIVAGAQSADLLDDLRKAVDKAISQGTTLEEFRRDFEEIVTRRGWTGWTGEETAAGRAWRAKVIYETNLRTSYAAGRWAQLQAAGFPYLRYKHNDNVLVPRPQHVAWDNLILRADDPWWRTHAPPNGWGCQCWIEGVSERELRRLGKDGPDEAPPSPIDPETGAPLGIDPGWAYAPGASVAEQINRLLSDTLEGLPEQVARDYLAAMAVPPPLPAPAWGAAGILATPSLGDAGVVQVTLTAAGIGEIVLDVRPGETVGGRTYNEWVQLARDGRAVDLP